MSERKLRARPRRTFVRTTDSTHALPTPTNVLDRDFTAEAPNRLDQRQPQPGLVHHSDRGTTLGFKWSSQRGFAAA